MPTALVSGALANKPANGGNAWTRLSWVRGLQRLGFEVLFVEQLERAQCAPAHRSYFDQVMTRFDLVGRSALLDEHGDTLRGLPAHDLRHAAQGADLLVNISGHLSIPALKQAARRKVYFDDDPGFTQFWHAAGDTGPRLDGHDFYYTIGMNIGSAGCPIPAGDIPWRHTRPPVVLEDWPVCPADPPVRFTTVASWRGAYGAVEFGGHRYGLKVHEFRKFVALPQHGTNSFEIALDIHPSDQLDRETLEQAGWNLVDPQQIAGDPDGFRGYIQASGAEFSAAQGIYVETNSGWFSDRTTRYLASGKPALVQDTGFGQAIPVGQGLLTFSSLEDAIDGAARIGGAYADHCRAAREIAEEFFDSDKVIGKLLEEVGIRA